MLHSIVTQHNMHIFCNSPSPPPAGQKPAARGQQHGLPERTRGANNKQYNHK